MAYNQNLVEQIRSESGERPIVEKKMFGKVGFLINGNLACGVHKQGLIVRVHPEKFERLLRKPGTRMFDITGRPMKGWIIVDPKGCQTAKQLAAWIREGIEFAGSLPPKSK